ncbi:hypothetical protein L209DRAFT_68896 [Thermothelomyces heterothallicus CBS 203.75]
MLLSLQMLPSSSDHFLIRWPRVSEQLVICHKQVLRELSVLRFDRDRMGLRSNDRQRSPTIANQPPTLAYSVIVLQFSSTERGWSTRRWPKPIAAPWATACHSQRSDGQSDVRGGGFRSWLGLGSAYSTLSCVESEDCIHKPEFHLSLDCLTVHSEEFSFLSLSLFKKLLGTFQVFQSMVTHHLTVRDYLFRVLGIVLI